TNSSGVATGTLSSTAATPKTVSATANGTGITQTQVVTVNPAAASGATSTATVPTTGTAGTATNITVQARDQFGNTVTVGGAAVVVTVTGANAATPAVTDNGNGTYSTSYTPTNAGPDNIAITLNSVAVAGSPFTSTVGSSGTVSPSLSTVAVSPGTITASSGSSQSTITVTVKDQFGNPIGGATVVLAATPTTGNTLTQPVGTTNASGVATGTLSSTSATPKTVSATANSVGITQTQGVTVNPDLVDPTQSTAVVPAGTAAVQTTITIQAKDQFGNNLTSGGATVVVTITGTNPGSAVVVDNLDGTYTATYTPASAGSDTIDITINSTAIQGSPFTSVVN
ncbi:MAG: invasin domain 3-containing protein, partial [Gemmatimonadales bacterium]